MSKVNKIFIWAGLGMVIIPEFFSLAISNLIYSYVAPISYSSSSFVLKHSIYSKTSFEFWISLAYMQLLGLYFIISSVIYYKITKYKKPFLYIVITIVIVSTSWFIYDLSQPMKINLSIP
jgi:hypothetical protein